MRITNVINNSSKTLDPKINKQNKSINTLKRTNSAEDEIKGNFRRSENGIGLQLSNQQYERSKSRD